MMQGFSLKPRGLSDQIAISGETMSKDKNKEAPEGEAAEGEEGEGGKKKLPVMMTQLVKKHQKLAMFNLGNAMSGAPICRGTTKFPKPATATGTIPKKTMMVPCMAPKTL